MSETLWWTPENEEDNPVITFELGDESFEMTRENSSAWTYLGKLAIYNHVHFVDDDGRGFHLFQDADGYEDITTMMDELSFPAHHNQLSVVDEIVDYYYEQAIFRLEESIDS